MEALDQHNAELKKQYEAFPYPHSHPTSSTTEPGGLPWVSQYVTGGRVPRSMRVLIAGGGTGNATLGWAQHFAEFGIDGEIVHLDLSANSIAIAQLRLKHAGLTERVAVRFINEDLTRAESLGLGAFDHINCSGVIHHLKDPQAALALLAGMLKPQGSMLVMVYGTIGRTGVYHLQQLLRDVVGNVEPLERRVELTRRVLSKLPVSNWFRKNVAIMSAKPEAIPDAEIYDLLLHSSDVSYTIPEFSAMIEQSGLKLHTFLQPLIYKLQSYTNEPLLLEKAQSLGLMEEAALVELFAGNIIMHRAMLVPAGSECPQSPAISRDAIPYMDASAKAKLKDFREITQLSLRQFGGTYWSKRISAPFLAARIINLVDGRRSVKDIYRTIIEAEPQLENSLGYSGFEKIFGEVYAFCHGISQMFLLRDRH